MARLFSLSLMAAGVATGLFSTWLRADNTMQMQATAPSAPPANMTNAAPVAPPPIPDTFDRYGKIWAPSDDVAHPVKLNLQFPGVGELKVPSQEELGVRDKLEQLATLSDADIRTQLAQWTPYNKMKLGDEGQMLLRIQQFKDQRTKIAMDKARDLGLLSSMTPDQKVRFEKEYWDKRLQMDRELAKQFEPVLRAREQKLKEELFREFSSATTNPSVPPPKPPPPPKPVALNTPTPAPMAQTAGH